MKRELGIARCGLACCLCTENEHCQGCDSGECSDFDWCENRKCSLEKGLDKCYSCEEKDCKKGLLAKIKPYGFIQFIRQYGLEKLLDCLEENEKKGVVYHREGINGDYDAFEKIEDLFQFILTGKDPFVICPEVETKHLKLRLLKPEDSEALFTCYHDKEAVKRMNDDNCDFGFYVDSLDKMKETVGYWIDFYQKRYFIRFTMEDKQTGKAIGTVEGFCGDVGVLRVDLASDYEKEEYLSEILCFAQENFNDYFHNQKLVIKAIPEACERRKALLANGWEFIDQYRNYGDYYACEL